MVRPPAGADAAGLPAAWRRDNCRCAECLDPATGCLGQRRHLQGCYADLDGVESAVAVAGREREKGKDRL